jgi:hypothetical protein
MRIRSPSWRLPLRGDWYGAYNIRFDNDIARTADHQQMLDVVTPDQHEAAAAIDRSSVDDGKPRLAPAGHPSAEACAEQAADQLESHHDQRGQQEIR